MTNDKSPKELCLHTVIAMDYAVAVFIISLACGS